MSTQNFVTKLGFNRKGYDLIETSSNRSLLLKGSSLNLDDKVNIIKKKISHLDEIQINEERYSIKKIDDLIGKISSNKYHTIIVYGGGSVIDVAKRFYLSLKKNNLDLKFVVIPTLIGSGAESSMTSVINSDSKKIVLSDQDQMPDTVIYDTDIIKYIDPKEIIFGSIDALTHCLESTTSFLTNPYLKFFSNQTIEYFFKEIELKDLLNKDLINDEDIKKFCILSFNGGLAQNNSGAGLCHAISHAAEEITSVRHSRCITYFLIGTIKFIQENNKNFFNDLKPENINNLMLLSNTFREDIENISSLDDLISDDSGKDKLISIAKKDPCWRLFNLKGKKDNILNDI